MAATRRQIMRTRTPQPPGRYSLLALLQDEPYERGLSDIAAARYGAPQLRGQALPTRQLARDLGIAAASSGGNLVATELERVAASVRPQLVLDQLGAARIEVSGAAQLDLPKFSGGVGGWIAEGEAAASLATTVLSTAAVARCAAARLGLSRRVMNANRSDIEASVLAEIRRAVADVIELGFLQGVGTESEPLGIVHAATGAKTYSGSNPTWAEIADQIAILGNANADLSRASWLLHPSDLAALIAAVVDGDGGETIVTWADGRHRIAGFPVVASANVPEGKHLFGDFSTVQQVFFGAPQLINDRYSGGKSINGSSELVLLNYCDLALREPAHIVIGSA